MSTASTASTVEHVESTRAAQRSRWAGALLYLGIAAVLVAAAAFGTALYNYYIPDIAAARDFHLGLLVIPIMGGVAAFLSPCAFGMLPGYYAAFLSLRGSQVEGDRPRAAVLSSLRYGLATAAGMLTVGILLAVILSLASLTFAPRLRVVTENPNDVTRTVRLAGSVVLILLGLAQLKGYRLPLVGRIAQQVRPLSHGERRPYLWFYSYGVLYVFIALPCVANLLAAPLLYAEIRGGADLAAVTSFLFLASMAMMALATSILVGLSKDALLRKFRTSARQVSQVAAVIFLAMGVTLLYFNLNLDSFRETFFRFPIKELPGS